MESDQGTRFVLADEGGEFFQWYSQIREALSGRAIENTELTELAEIVREYSVPQQFVFDLLRGLAKERQLDQYPDYPELRTWAYQTCSTLWLVVLKIGGLDLDDPDRFGAAVDMGIAHGLILKLANMVPQLETKRIFLPEEEWVDRRLDLLDQSEPVDELLWKDLIQYQCLRVEEHLQNARPLGSCFEKKVNGAIRKRMAVLETLLKKIRRNPVWILREPMELGAWDRIKINVRQVLGATAPL